MTGIDVTTCVVLSKGGSRDVKAGSLFIHRGGMATSLRGMGIHKRLLSKSIPKSINPTFQQSSIKWIGLKMGMHITCQFSSGT